MTNPRKTYKHVASPREAVDRIFDYEPQHYSLSEILRARLEKAETAYENAQNAGEPSPEIESKKAALEDAQRDSALAIDLSTELKTTADHIKADKLHPHLVISSDNSYGAGPYFTKASLYYWANHAHGFDIADWKAYISEPPDTKKVIEKTTNYTDGQNYFLVLAYFTDQLLTAANGDWRNIVADNSNKTTNRFLINGRINVKAIASKIDAELPALHSAKIPLKAIQGHIDKITIHLTAIPGQIVDLSTRQIPAAKRTLYGLARATFSELGKTNPDRNAIGYPTEDKIDLTGTVPYDLPLEKKVIDKCLLTAKAEVTRQRDNDEEKHQAVDD